MYSSQSVAIAVVSIVFPVCASAIVAIRFFARSINRVGFGADDYLAVAALVFAWALCILCLNGSINGSLGRNLRELTPPDFVVYQKHIYFAVLFAYMSFGIAKLAVIMLYRRIFRPVATFGIVLWVAFGIVTTWIVVTIFLAVFSAWPVSHFWELGADYSFDHPKWLFANTCLDTFLDLAILCLPVQQVLHLQMDARKRLQCIGAFAMGLFCVVSAGLRIYFGYKLSLTNMSAEEQIMDPEFGYIVASNVIWCEIEACCSTIAACLPCFVGLFRVLSENGFFAVLSSWATNTLSSLRSFTSQSTSSFTSSFSRKQGSRGSDTDGSRDRSRDSYPLSRSPCSSSTLSYEAKGTQTEDLEKGEIRMTREFEISWPAKAKVAGEKGVQEV